MKVNVKSIIGKIAPLLALIILGLVLTILLPGKFLRASNLMNILKQAGINCMI